MPKLITIDIDLTKEAARGNDVVVALVPPAAPFDLNASPSHLLHRAQQIAADLHLETFGGSGLTQRQFAVLSVLGASDGISQSELVAQTGIDRSTLAEMVARMEARGLMLRTKSPTDSRANAVSLTPQGRAALAEALPKLAEIDIGVLALLPLGKRDSLVGLLARIALPNAEQTSSKKAKGSDAPKAKKKDKKKKDRKKKKAARD
jgi:MarR family transcriptional regulator, temperature-dependent positive regulator of motility